MALIRFETEDVTVGYCSSLLFNYLYLLVSDLLHSLYQEKQAPLKVYSSANALIFGDSFSKAERSYYFRSQ